MNIGNFVEHFTRADAQKRKQMRVNAETMAQSGVPAKKAAAERALTEYGRIESDEIRIHTDLQRAKPPSERVIDAFRRNPATPSERKIIKALIANPRSTSSELSVLCGYAGQSAWHLRFGTMCRDRRADLWPAPPAEERNVDFYSGILADWDDATRTFTMKPDVAEAFGFLGI